MDLFFWTRSANGSYHYRFCLFRNLARQYIYGVFKIIYDYYFSFRHTHFYDSCYYFFKTLQGLTFMKKKLQNPYVFTFLFSVAIFIIHYLIDLVSNVVTYYSLFSIYVFHTLSALAVAGIVQLVYKNSQDHAGFAFMGTSLLKMLAAILFLLPGFLSDDKPSFINILNFFIPYFLFLIFEAIQVIKLINQEETSAN